MRILLIEDNAKIATLHRRLLAQLCKGTVEHAPNARRAKELLAATAPAFDLVVSDYDLGPASENGGDILAWLRQERPGAEERFLFLSGNEEVLKLHRHALLKPATATEILAAVQAMPVAAQAPGA